MFWWLLKNYFKLSEFMEIELNPFKEIAWTVSGKISHNDLNEEQKKLSDEFRRRLRKIDLGY